MDLIDKAKAVVTALEDRKAVDVKTYDVRGVSGLCDVFVVAAGTASPHLKGLAAAVQCAMKDVGERSFRVSGDPESGWMALDFVDIVVHVFSPEARAYYALEKLWEKAPPIV